MSELIRICKNALQQELDAEFDDDEKWVEDVLDRMEDEPVSIDGYDVCTVHQFGGEGKGDEYFYVLKVSYDGKDKGFVKIPGSWASYQGSELYLDDMYEVIPKEVTVTQYVKA